MLSSDQDKIEIDDRSRPHLMLGYASMNSETEMQKVEGVKSTSRNVGLG